MSNLDTSGQSRLHCRYAMPLKTKKTDFSVFLKFHDSIISRMVQKSVSICGQSVSSFSGSNDLSRWIASATLSLVPKRVFSINAICIRSPFMLHLIPLVIAPFLASRCFLAVFTRIQNNVPCASSRFILSCASL